MEGKKWTGLSVAAQSQLQEKILTIVCTMKNVHYVLLMQETNRDRVAIAQSVDSLAKHVGMMHGYSDC